MHRLAAFGVPQGLTTGAVDELTQRPGVRQRAASRCLLGGVSSLPSLPFRGGGLGTASRPKAASCLLPQWLTPAWPPLISQDMATGPQLFLWASSPDSHSHVTGRKHLGLPLQLGVLRP